MPNQNGNIEVEYPEDGTADRDTYYVSPEQYDPDEHTLAYDETWTPSGAADDGSGNADDDTAEPSDELKEMLTTRQANALARAGLATVEAAVTYHMEEGDLTEFDGVGQGTVDNLPQIGD